MLRKIWDGESLAIVLGWLAVAVHYLIFGRFFPSAQGTLGHDYAYVLPMLLEGNYWLLVNGPFSVPWHTPSFCGGMPLFPNPATFYFSVTQALAFVWGPLAAVRLTLLLFAALGFWGFHRLLRRSFRAGPWTALLGGALFLFNGFYAHRMLMGHLEFHGFMLVPWIALSLLEAPRPDGPRWRRLGGVAPAALMLAYAFLSGMAQLVIPSVLAVAILALLKKQLDGDGFSLAGFAGRLALAGLWALGLSAAKLSASLAFLGSLPREGYRLPGVDGLGRLGALTLRVLALGGGGVDGEAALSNQQVVMDRHEFEYGVGVVPFALLLAALLWNGRRLGRLAMERVRSRRAWSLALLGALLFVPLLLNLYTPGWNAFLKSVPVLRSLSNLLRWLVAYVPFVVALAALAVEGTEPLRRRASWIAAGGLAALLLQNLLADRGYYRDQPYQPGPIEEAWRVAAARAAPPPVSEVTVSRDASGRPALTIDRNGALMAGGSQLLCYEPMFGFRLEFLPFQDIHPGPVTLVREGRFNLKNPACYVFPEENGCRPGDHFRVDQREELERFVARRPFAFAVSPAQRAASAVSLASLALAGLWALLSAAFAARRWGEAAARRLRRR